MFRVFAFVFLFPALSYACSICGCGDPLEASGQSLPMAGQWRLGIDWESLGARATSDEDEGRRDSLAQTVFAPTLSYSPSSDWTASLRLPFNQKAWSSIGGAEDPEKGSSSGMGDLDLGLRWFFWGSMNMASQSSRFAALTLGSSINTGESQLMHDDVRVDEHMQPGTGAAGPYAGILLGGTVSGWKALLHAGYFAHAQNFSAYQYGSAFKGGIGLRKELSEVHAFGLALEGRYADYDRTDGLTVLNSGGTLLELVPSLQIKLGERLGLGFKAKLPVFTALFGGQDLVPGFASSLQYILN